MTTAPEDAGALDDDEDDDESFADVDVFESESEPHAASATTAISMSAVDDITRRERGRRTRFMGSSPRSTSECDYGRTRRGDCILVGNCSEPVLPFFRSQLRTFALQD